MDDEECDMASGLSEIFSTTDESGDVEKELTNTISETMETPAADQLPDKEEERPEYYKKDTGSAGIQGQLFECKFFALVYLRATNLGWKFKLASNVRGLKPFDDALVEYLDKNSRKSHTFVQLKTKETHAISMKQLLADRGDFSLRKYYESYIQIEKKVNCGELGVKMDVSFGESLFIIYTNANIAANLKSNKATDISEENFLTTGGSVLQFDEQKHKAIYKSLKDLPKLHRFLSQFRIFYTQANEKEMDCHIKTELHKSMELRESELDMAYMCFNEYMMEWWKNQHYVLKDTNPIEKDPLRKTSEKVRPTLLNKIPDQRKSELQALSIRYEESAITYIKQLTEPHKAVLILTHGSPISLTAAKIHQTLSDTKHVILNLQQLIRHKTDVMVAWKISFDVLVLESGGSADVSPDLFNELSSFLNKSVSVKKFIFISNSLSNIQEIHELRRAFHTNLTEMGDVFKPTDLVPESRMVILDRKVVFQGVEMELSKLLRTDNVRLLDTLDCDSISQLLENRKPSIGISTADTVNYYIDRTLQFRKRANTPLPAQGEMQLVSRGDSLQERRERFPRLEEDIGSETATCWKPTTLFEGDGRIILITDEPGMGKSTLLTHLAHQTQNHHPNMWIVRVNINSHTRILDELKKNGCDGKGVIKLLTEAAQVKETGGVVLERRLFDYTYNSTGNMAVLIDGVDEVSPLYIEEVIQVLKILSQTMIERIWVTSRISVEGRLEKEFQYQSYSLVPFNEEDQKRFLVKFWKQTCPEIEDDYLDNLANQVVKLSTEQLNVEDKKFMGIPLQSLLLGEIFEGNLKEYSTSSTVELPEHINVVMLYARYIEKKWGIYIQEKKCSDQTNVMVIDDDAELQKTFIHNHMAAALMAILSTQQLEKLTDKKIAENGRKFVEKINVVEKTGIIIEVTEGRPVFQHRTLAEYLVARWLCDNYHNGKTFMRDYLFEAGFRVVRSMVDRILAEKCTLHEAVLNCNMNQVEKLLKKEESMTEKDDGGRTPLHVAVSCSSPKLIQLLLERGADVSSEDTLLGYSTVQYAIGMADWELLSLLMEKRPDVREQVLNGAIRDCKDKIACALHAAAQYGHNDLLKYLVSKGNYVNRALPGDNSILIHVAARSQQTDTVRMLLLLGASIVCQDGSGKTPLHVSVETGNLELIKCLVEHQETVQRETELQHVNTKRNVTKGHFLHIPDKDGNTPLHLSVTAGNTEIVSFLVSAGSDLNACNLQGEYPLTLAALSSKNEIVELLLQSEMESNKAKIGAMTAAVMAGNVKATDLLLRSGLQVSIGEKEKPIHVASRLGHKEIIILLLQYGASLTSRTDTGNTALHLACEAGHLNLVTYLVEVERSGMFSLNFENETPLHLAARNGRDCLVTYFAENSCNINAASAKGATCLHVACENGHYTTVKCLLNHGAEVNVMNSAYQTPLHIAASRGQTKVVELLFQHKANFSLRDKDGVTALLAASINGHQDTVRFIVQHGGNIEDTDRNGNTILHFAVQNDNIDILNFLSQRNVSLDVQNSNGDTSLLQAVREGRNRMVQYLVERNCDINTQGKDGMRPLDIAVLKGNMEATRILLERNASSGKANMHIVAAARFGFLDLLQHFIARGNDINMKGDNGESLLQIACKYGHVATVQYLCEHGVVLDWQDNNGNTALHMAVEVEHKKICQILLNSGASVNAEDRNGKSPLALAAEKSNIEILQKLLKDTAIKDLWTPLSTAATKGHTEVVRELLIHGASVNSANKTQATTLCAAAAKGHVEVVEELLKHGMAVDSTDAYGSTLLSMAAANGHVEVVKELLNHGMAVDSTDAYGSTPLSMAAANGHVEVVTELLNRSAAVDSTDAHGRTPFWSAAAKGHVKVVKGLLKLGAAVDIPDEYGITPLRVAATNGHVEVATELLNRGAAVDMRDKYGSTPLSMAAAKGHVGVVRELLNRRALVDSKGMYGRTPLWAAAAKGHVEVVTELLNHGADVDSVNNDYITPLSVAAGMNHMETVRQLLKCGASVHINDKYGRPPLVVAASEGQEEIFQELLNHKGHAAPYQATGLTPTTQSPINQSTHNLQTANSYKCMQLTPKTASEVLPEDGRLTPETCRGSRHINL